MKKRTGNLWITGILIVVLFAVQTMGVFQNFEYRIQDSRYQIGGLVSPEIYVIGIDEETRMEYGAWQSWDARRWLR